MSSTWIDRIQENRVFRAVIAVVFALALATPTALLNSAKAWADEEQDTTALTFVLNGEANVTIEGDNINATLTAEDNQISLDVKTGTAVHLTGSLTEANNVSITTRDTQDSFDVNTPEGFESTTSFEKDITAGGTDKVVDINIGELPSQESLAEAKLPFDAEEQAQAVNANAGISTMSIEPRSSSVPYVGEVFDGYGVIDYVSGGNGHTVNYCDYRPTSGIATDIGTFRVYCSDHGRAAPSAGGVWYYKATVTAIDYDSGWVSLSFWITGTGEYIYEDGYQRLEATSGVHRDFGGWIELQKASANTDITNGNDCYSLEGAEYGVYKSKANAESDSSRITTLKTDSDGYAKTDRISAATYYVKETKPPKGYALDETVYTVTVRNGQTVSVNGGEVEDYPQNDPVGILLGKFDGEFTYNGQANLPQGAASLYGAEFTITYYDGQYSSAEEAGYKSAENAGNKVRQWVFATSSNGYIDPRYDTPIRGDDVYLSSDGVPTFPLGTYIIQETKAPSGYNLNDEIFVRNITSGEFSTETVNTYNTPQVPDTVRRGDVEFSKASGDDQNRLANVPFRITSKTTGESHIIFTDENGYWTSSSDYNAHSNDPNGNDDAYADNALVEENYNAEAGTWFGMNADGETTEPNDDMGALPYDSYTVEELSCANNEGLQLVNTEFTVSRDGFTIDLGTIDDPNAFVTTSATDALDGNKYVIADPESTINDHAIFSGFKSGDTFKVETKVCNLDHNNNVVFSSSTNYTATKDGNTLDIPCKFDTTSYVGCRLGITHTVYDDQGRVVAEHNGDLSDEDQIVTIVQTEIDTTATDTTSNSKEAVIDPGTNITDTINVKNAIEGDTYNAHGELMRIVTNDDGSFAVAENNVPKVEPFTVGGETVTSDIEFTADDSTATADMNFSFDATEYAGQEVYLVVFETISKDDKVVVEEKDPANENQQVKLIPTTIGTQAKDTVDGDNLIVIDKTSSITDTVSHTNAISGDTYTGYGLIMNEDTHLPTLFGEGADEISNRDLKAFMDELCDALHIDRIEVPESVLGPEPENDDTAADTEGSSESADQTNDSAQTQESVDQESFLDHFANMVTGNTEEDNTSVEFEQTSLNSDASATIDFDQVNQILTDHSDIVEYLGIAQSEYTPDKANSSFDMVFNDLDSTALAQNNSVVFELFVKDNHIIASHLDYTDENQKVEFIPTEIKTELVDKTDGDHYFLPSTNTTLVDTVSFKGVIPGDEVVIKGTLMNQATNEPYLDAKDQPVTGEIRFTPNKSEGSVEVEFTFDSTNMTDGDSITAFEYMYKDEILIAEHTDIGDEAQTATIGYPPEGDVYDKTGQNLIGVIIAAALIAGAGGAIMYRSLKKRDEAAQQAEQLVRT